MEPALLVLVAAAAALPLAAAAPADTAGSVIAVSESGIMHLDRSGALLAWRPEVSQWWQSWHLTTNPRNGSVCWVSSPEDQSLPGVMRCAQLASLNQTWDLPKPEGFRVSKMDAIAFDWLEENWYLTVSRVNYVCSYMFDRCAKLGKSGGNVRYFATYDIPNRLLFRIATEGAGAYTLEVMNLDGSDVRQLPTSLDYPAGMAVDPVNRELFVIDQTGGFGFEHGLYKMDYNGEGKTLVAKLDKEGFGVSWRRSLDVLGGTAIAAYSDQKVISSISTSDGTKEELVNGAVKGATVPALASVEKLLAVKIFSPTSQPETEHQCANDTCAGLCIPTAANGTAGTTCLCPAGERLVDLGCHVEYPLHAVVSGGDKMQAVDMQTDQVTTILDGLTNVSRVDFLWTGGEEFLLYWVDAGSVFSGRWLPGGTVFDVRTLHEASETRHVVEVAVDWAHRNLIWMERDTAASKQYSVLLSSLDGSYQKRISKPSEKRRQAMFVYMYGSQVGYAQDNRGTLEFETIYMSGKRNYYSSIGVFGNRYLKSMPSNVAVHLSLSKEPWQTRFLWVSGGDQSIEMLSQVSELSNSELSSLLKHPSLAEVGGLDVLDTQLFWTERSTGKLWRADTGTGGKVRPMEAVTAGGPLRLLHPWLQPQPKPRLIACDAATRNGCSHFCVTVFESFEPVPLCLCPDGLELGDDKKTCQ